MSLIIILIFCLSPLSAIDLNGDNSTVIDDDNNNTDLAIEDASLNEKKDIKVSEVNEDEEELLDPELSVHVPDANPAEEPLAEIRLNANYTGNVTIKCDGAKLQTVTIRNGLGYVGVGNALLPGEHTVEVNSSANKGFFASEAKTTFNISNVPTIYGYTNDILDDEPLYVHLRTASQYNGLIVCSLEDGSVEYGYAHNGLFTCNFNQTECFTSGFHNLHVIVVGDGVFSLSETDITFHVK